MRTTDSSLAIVAICITIIHIGAISYYALCDKPLVFSKPTERLVVKTIKTRKKQAQPLPKPQKKRIVKQPVNEKKQALIAKARENFSKMQKNAPQDTVELKDLGMLESLHIDTSDAKDAKDMGYYGALASALKQKLRLPEVGDVKIRLTLSRKGGVINVETVQADNATNRQHVEAMIPKIHFPPFGKSFMRETQHTFTMTLINEK